MALPDPGMTAGGEELRDTVLDARNRSFVFARDVHEAQQSAPQAAVRLGASAAALHSAPPAAARHLALPAAARHSAPPAAARHYYGQGQALGVSSRPPTTQWEAEPEAAHGLRHPKHGSRQRVRLARGAELAPSGSLRRAPPATAAGPAADSSRHRQREQLSHNAQLAARIPRVAMPLALSTRCPALRVDLQASTLCKDALAPKADHDIAWTYLDLLYADGSWCPPEPQKYDAQRPAHDALLLAPPMHGVERAAWGMTWNYEDLLYAGGSWCPPEPPKRDVQRPVRSASLPVPPAQGSEQAALDTLQGSEQAALDEPQLACSVQLPASSAYSAERSMTKTPSGECARLPPTREHARMPHTGTAKAPPTECARLPHRGTTDVKLGQRARQTPETQPLERIRPPSGVAGEREAHPSRRRAKKRRHMQRSREASRKRGARGMRGSAPTRRGNRGGSRSIRGGRSGGRIVVFKPYEGACEAYRVGITSAHALPLDPKESVQAWTAFLLGGKRARRGWHTMTTASAPSAPPRGSRIDGRCLGPRDAQLPHQARHTHGA
ncbi:hypothetical protein CYMTET_9257 [Cymbomonas tetramitiformis]|uniref:Uncharacterized protein n=1 Tax=Cymbomonas tetramitiformis TaxID=36881 RepID=A0AAE0GRK9_9CHLO|nr:hypothetical protein CYMTET_9257 [Cymbomonas tetramitiformis]